MLKHVTDLIGDRCRGCQTMIRSSVLVAASQTWELNLLLIKIQTIQKFRVKMLVEVIKVLVLIIDCSLQMKL